MADQLNNNAVGLAIAQAINQLSRTFPQASGTSGTASGGSATLPANPVTFVSIVVNGTTYKIPAYS